VTYCRISRNEVISLSQRSERISDEFGSSTTKAHVAQAHPTAKASAKELSEIQAPNEQRGEPASPGRQAVKKRIRQIRAHEFNEMTEDANY
jgi:hypothetical protein